MFLCSRVSGKSPNSQTMKHRILLTSMARIEKSKSYVNLIG
nr:MAG TPA: hypothetical protein [Caudoviricetes sp.]